MQLKKNISTSNSNNYRSSKTELFTLTFYSTTKFCDDTVLSHMDKEHCTSI